MSRHLRLQGSHKFKASQCYILRAYLKATTKIKLLIRTLCGRYCYHHLANEKIKPGQLRNLLRVLQHQESGPSFRSRWWSWDLNEDVCPALSDRKQVVYIPAFARTSQIIILYVYTLKYTLQISIIVLLWWMLSWYTEPCVIQCLLSYM